MEAERGGLRVHFRNDATASHAYDINNVLHPGKATLEGPEPTGKPISVMRIFRDEKQGVNWYEVGYGNFHPVPHDLKYLVKVRFSPDDAVRNLQTTRGVIRPTDHGRSPPNGLPCVPFAIFHGHLHANSTRCCWVKLGNKWCCVPC